MRACIYVTYDLTCLFKSVFRNPNIFAYPITLIFSPITFAVITFSFQRLIELVAECSHVEILGYQEFLQYQVVDFRC